MNRKCQMGFAVFAMFLAACGGGAASTGTGSGSGSGNGSGSGSGTCDEGVVCVLGNTFNPVDLTVAKNASVTFSAKTTIVHNIVFDPPVASLVTDIGIFSEGNVSRTFTTVGTFPYHCTIHGGVGTGMHGSIKVQ